MKRRLIMLGVLANILPESSASAQQTSYVIDQARSSVWWQMDPHLGHLWATTCPLDPSWQPGEGHSAGYVLNYKKRPKIKLTHESEAKVPLFPRDSARANCRKALSGSFATTDARRFANFKGTVVFRIDSITNGSDLRDRFAEKQIYSSARYPTVQFTIDSLTNVTMSQDTVNAIAVGTFSLRGVDKPTRVQVQGVPDANGLRVRGKFAMSASELTSRYGVSKVALGMGVGLKMWNTLFMGFDLILAERRQ